MAAIVLIAAAAPASAGDHTWIAEPRMRILSAGTTTVDQVVVVVGARITWGAGNFNTGFHEMAAVMMAEQMGQVNAFYMAQAVVAQIAISYSSVCRNPLLSAEAKATTSQSDTTFRWLASQEMYNTFILKNIWNLYQQQAPIKIIINGHSYKGFTVTYKDGGQETWVVNPAASISTMKLFETPAPGSQKPPGTGPAC
jgi:hypothetical protein